MRLIFVDHSTKLSHVRELETRARGGMVSSLFQVTDYLSWRGHDVTVLSDIESTGATQRGTKWLHEHWGKYDVLVMNRGIGDGYPNITAKYRVLWTHDLPHNGFAPDPQNLKAVDRVVFMSGYAEKLWRTFFRDIGKSVRIPNGVQKNWFFPRPKEPGYLIYASAPNRGLDKLPLIFDSIDTRVTGDLEMRAYSNLETLHPNEGGRYDYKTVQDSNVDLRKPIPQKALAQELGKAVLMVLPTDYPEICSNLVLQSLASGTPVITTGNIGATPEWVKHGRNGMLTRYQPRDYMIHILEVVRNTVTVLESPRLLRRLQRGTVRTKILTWGQVGARWERMLRRLR